jgi:pimeloyl-ACP methyl ester carboxylesterase
MKPITRPKSVKRRLQLQVRSLRRRYQGAQDVSLKPELDSDSRTLLITFGGLGVEGGMPSFEFGSTTSAIPVKRLFVRDPHQSWYHRGARRGPRIASVAESLSELIAQHDVRRLVTAGNSAGGYAALLFGTLLGADTALAFAPQTVLDCDILDEIDDHRWDWRLRPLTAQHALEPEWLDLQVALPRVRRSNIRYNVYFADTVRCDRLHAERLRDLEGVRLYRFGRGGHRFVRDLRDCGALERVLRHALDADGPAIAASEQLPPERLA